MRSPAEQCNREMMCGLRLKRKQQRPNKSLVKIFHVRVARSAVAPYHYSFPNAKLAEHRVENLFHIDKANYFANRSQCFIKMNRSVFRRQSVGL